MPFGLSLQTIGFIEVMAGGLGLYFALGGFGRATDHGWRNRQDKVSAWGLLIFSGLLVLNGLIFWLGL